jgi:conjugative relaxase-like TrwC/TraI family protein
VLSISSGHSADYLLDAVATGRESYYTNATAEGEPPGRWYGAGAESLGLAGEVDPDVMRAVYGEFRDPRDPDGNRRVGNPPRNYPNGEALRDKLLAKEPDATPERQEEIAAEAERMVRNNIGFYDATFSPPKSVTVVHAAYESQEVKARAAGDDATADMWAAKRELVEEAIWEGNRAQLNYLAEHAGYTRVGHHGGGAGRWVDAHDWTVASFFQHDSRNHDPQLHIHNAILNRVEGPDGKWRTLSGQDLNLAKRGAGAVGDRAMFEHLAAKSGLPSAMRSDGRCRELTGVDQKVMDHFSTRTQALTPKAAELAREYERTYGRAPNTVQMHRFNQQATLATRPAKEHTSESGTDRLARWDRELRTEIGSGLAAVAENVGKQQPPEPRPFDVTATLETAVAAAQASDSRFTLSSALAEIDATLPDYLGGLSGAESHAMLRALAELAVESDPVLSLRADAPGAESLPAEFQLANGRSAFTQPESDLFATKEHVRSERALQAAAMERGAAAMSPELAEFFTTELAELGIELGVDQRAAVQGVLTDGAKLSAFWRQVRWRRRYSPAMAWKPATSPDGSRRRNA